jgi:hypothetical protein
MTDCRAREYGAEKHLRLKGRKKETENGGELHKEVLHHLLFLPRTIRVVNPTGRSNNMITDIKGHT